MSTLIRVFVVFRTMPLWTVVTMGQVTPKRPANLAVSFDILQLDGQTDGQTNNKTTVRFVGYAYFCFYVDN